MKLFDLAEYRVHSERIHTDGMDGVAAEACSSSWFDLSSPHVFDLSRLISRKFAGRRQPFFLFCAFILVM